MELPPICADMAELADALDSGSSSRKGVEVQVLLSAPIVWGELYEREKCYTRTYGLGYDPPAELTAILRSGDGLLILRRRGAAPDDGRAGSRTRLAA